jgi:hypothetical protein
MTKSSNNDKLIKDADWTMLNLLDPKTGHELLCRISISGDKIEILTNLQDVLSIPTSQIQSVLSSSKQGFAVYYPDEFKSNDTKQPLKCLVFSPKSSDLLSRHQSELCKKRIEQQIQP